MSRTSSGALDAPCCQTLPVIGAGLGKALSADSSGRLVSIVKAVQGDAEGAKKWGIISAITGVVVIVLYIIASVVLGVGMAAQSGTM